VSAGVRLGAGVSAGYAAGSLVTGAFSTVPGLLLLPYLTDTLGVAAGAAGVLAFAPKAWNVLLNPLAGRISDRAGARRPFVLVAGLGVAAGFAVMFAGPLAGAAGAAWAAVGYLAMASTFAFFQSPYTAMPAEMTDDYADRTRLMSWRVAGIAVAVLASGALAPAVVSAAGGGIPGYRAMGVVIGTLVAVGAVAAFVGTRRAPLTVAPGAEPGLRRQLGVAWANGPFRLLLVVVTVQSAATGALLAGVVYVARHVLGDPGATVRLLVAFTLPAVVVLPLLVRAAAHVDKRAGVLVSSAVFVVASLALLLAPGAGPAAVLALAVVLGCANAVQDTFVLALLPDCIAHETARTGRRQAGVFAGLFSGGQGLGFAVGPLLFGLVLQVAGYLPSTTGTAAAQSASTAAAVLAGFAVLPAALTALSMPAVLRHPGAVRRPRPA
jgi:Na+/melibiose symporter-like transporter